MGCSNSEVYLPIQNQNPLLSYRFPEAVSRPGNAPGIQSKLICKISNFQLPSTLKIEPLAFYKSSGGTKGNQASKAFYSALQICSFNTTFNFSQVNQLEGKFKFWLNSKGKWQLFTADNSLACDLQDESLSVHLLARGLELNKTIKETVSGLRGCAMQILEESEQGFNKVSVKEFILKYLKQNNRLCISNGEGPAETGYIIQQFKQVSDKFGNKNWIARINNSINPKMWKGKWGFDWEGWPDECANELNLVLNNKGTNYMCLQDLVREFDKLSAYFIRDNYFVTELTLSKARGQASVVLRAEERAKGWLNVYQSQRRYLRIVLARVRDGIYQALPHDTFQNSSVISLEVDLLGDFVVFIFSDEELPSLWAHVYASQPVQSTQLQTFRDVKQQLEGLCRASASQSLSSRIHKYKSEKVSRTSGTFAGLYFYYYKNEDASLSLFERISLQKQVNVRFANSQSRMVMLQVPAGKSLAVLLTTSHQPTSSYKFQCVFTSYLIQRYVQSELRQMARKGGVVEKRQINGKQIDVEVKVLKFQGGIAYYYDNRMQNYSFVQIVTFNIKNLRVRSGSDEVGSEVKVQLAPKEDTLIILDIVSPWESTSLQRKVVSQLTADTFHFRKR